MVSDRLVFDKIKQRLGGRVRLIVSGGAPLTPALEEFLKVAMCAPVVQVRGGGAGGGRVSAGRQSACCARVG